MTLMSWAKTHTPDGVFTIITNEDNVLASGWSSDLSALSALIHPGLRSSSAPATGASPAQLSRAELSAAELSPAQDSPVSAQALAAVTAYYDGDPSLLAQVPVKQRSGPFREHAWGVLREVEPGSSLTYAEYAARIGNPRVVRAAASACAKNAAALFVPCHRIIRSDGSLGGFRYGLEIKQGLLAREAQLRTSA